MTTARDDILSAISRTDDRTDGRRMGRGSAAVDDVIARLAAKKQNVRPARSVDDETVVHRFIEEAERAGTDVRRAASPEEIPGIVATYLRDANLAGDIRVSSDPDYAAIPWASEPMITTSTGPADPADTASLGIAFCGIAETGTLMMTSSPENPSMLNYLPILHIGVVAEEKIVGGLETAWVLLREQSGECTGTGTGTVDMPRMINLITGPSRTADIEQELLMGAHGPQSHMVIILNKG
ncbi:MAG: lactate utilization protein [Rhodospirillales bacterium]|nr:lactate utilization protein [Rhodospirillales bacterium]